MCHPVVTPSSLTGFYPQPKEESRRKKVYKMTQCCDFPGQERGDIVPFLCSFSFLYKKLEAHDIGTRMVLRSATGKACDIN
jgi:hypothetical protein